MSTTDFYEVLGISPTSEDVVVQAAFKALMRKHHPDTNNSAGAEARAKAINEAYSVLKDPARRARYDAQRHRSGQKKASPPPPPRPSAARPRGKAERPKAPPHPIDKPGDRTVSIAIAAAVLVAVGVGLYSVELGSADPVREVDSSWQPPGWNDAETPAAVGDASAVSEGETGPQTPPEELVPSLGESSDKIVLAVRTFVSVQRQNGMAGATSYSMDCFAAAERKADIVGVDFCVAFDIAATEFDRAVAGQAGWPTHQYFVSRDDAFRDAYSRFTQAAPLRIENVRSQVIGMLAKEIENQIIQTDEIR